MLCMCVYVCLYMWCMCVCQTAMALQATCFILSHSMPNEFIMSLIRLGLQYDQSTPQPMERSGEKGSITK